MGRRDESTLRILYVTVDDAANKRGATNNGYYIGRALQQAGTDVQFLGHGKLPVRVRARYIVPRVISKFIGCSRPLITEPAVIDYMQQTVIATMRESAADLVFGNSVQALAGLQGKAPYCIMTDAPAVGLVEMGHYFEHWCKGALEKFIQLDRDVSRGAEMIFYHSEWAATSAIDSYGLDPDRVFVVNPGANLDYVPRQLDDCTVTGSLRKVRLLFFGRDWERKGGPLAVRIVEELVDRSLECRLIVCGPRSVPDEIRGHALVDYVEPIDKDSSVGLKRFTDLFRSVDCLLLPTRSEASAGAIREAAAFGVPSVTSDVGGVPSLIMNGVNGFMLPIDATPSEYANILKLNLTDAEKWQKLRAGSREAYEKRLNWDVAGARMVEMMTIRMRKS